MSDEKTLPTHRLSFSEIQIDADQQDKVGRPIEVATAWPRKNGKEGSTIQWHIKPEKLGEGVWYLLDAQRNRSQQQDTAKALDQIDGQAVERTNSRER